jgi:hypothetical protein
MALPSKKPPSGQKTSMEVTGFYLLFLAGGVFLMSELNVFRKAKNYLSRTSLQENEDNLKNSRLEESQRLAQDINTAFLQIQKESQRSRQEFIRISKELKNVSGQVADETKRLENLQKTFQSFSKKQSQLDKSLKALSQPQADRKDIALTTSPVHRSFVSTPKSLSFESGRLQFKGQNFITFKRDHVFQDESIYIRMNAMASYAKLAEQLRQSFSLQKAILAMAPSEDLQIEETTSQRAFVLKTYLESLPEFQGVEFSIVKTRSSQSPAENIELWILDEPLSTSTAENMNSNRENRVGGVR